MTKTAQASTVAPSAAALADVPAHPQASQRESVSDKLQRGDVMAADCPSRLVLQHLTSRWGVLVLIALLSGTQRFSQLQRKIGGINERMLAQTLQWLEADAMVTRHAYKTVPPHVEYTLTPMGEEAADKVRDLVDWLEMRLPTILQASPAGQVDRAVAADDVDAGLSAR